MKLREIAQRILEGVAEEILGGMSGKTYCVTLGGIPIKIFKKMFHENSWNPLPNS